MEKIHAMRKQRETELDILRCLSTLVVIMVHVCRGGSLVFCLWTRLSG